MGEECCAVRGEFSMAASVASLSYSAGTLLLTGVPVGRLHGWMPDVGWVYDDRAGACRSDAQHNIRVTAELERRRIRFENRIPVPREVHWRGESICELRPEQLAAVEAWQQSGGRGCIVMPTGTGKTEVALRIMQLTRVSTLVVAPVRDLMYQWHQRILGSLNYDAGIIGDNIHRVHPVSVTTYDSACIHMPTLGDQFGLIIFDECHHLPGPIRRDAARMSAAGYRLGLTATLERSDGLHGDLRGLIGPTVYELSITAVRGKALADYDVVRIPVHLSLSEQRRYEILAEEVQTYFYQARQGEPGFTWEQLCMSSAVSGDARRALRAFHAKKSIEDRAEEKLQTLEDLFRLHAHERCIVFAGSNAMARDVSMRFLIPCLLSHCGKRERQEILEGFASGRYRAIVANQVLDEGIDVPAAKVAIVIGGLGSSRQARQRLGRILRRSGNERAILYEVVCVGTKDEQRSRERRRHETFKGIRRKRGRSAC